MSLFQSVRFISEWISVSLILLSFLYIKTNRYLSYKIQLFRNSFYLKPYISSIILVLIIFISSFLPYWATGILGQHRTMNIAYFIFILMWFVNLTVWYNYQKINFKSNSLLFIVFIAILFFQLTFTHNSYTIISDLFYKRHIKYNMQMENRYISIENATQDTIYINKLSDVSKSLYVLDVRENPDYWVNKGYLIYFNKKDKTLIGIDD